MLSRFISVFIHLMAELNYGLFERKCDNTCIYLHPLMRVVSELGPINYKCLFLPMHVEL